MGRSQSASSPSRDFEFLSMLVQELGCLIGTMQSCVTLHCEVAQLKQELSGLRGLYSDLLEKVRDIDSVL